MSTPPATFKPQTYGIKPLRDLPEERRQEIAQLVLERYLQGEEIRAISEDFGRSHYTIYGLLFQLCEDQWRDAQVSRATARHADAIGELDAIKKAINEAEDALQVAKQRELLKVAEARLRSAQWELERLLRRLYGANAVPTPGQEVVHIDIGIYHPEYEKAAPAIEGEATSE